MKENGNILKNTAILSMGRVIGFALSFFIPFFLSRWLPVDEYGTYKQIMLIWMFLYQVTNWGVDEGLFFFIKSHPEKKSIFSLNTIIFDLFMTTIVAIVLFSFPSLLASLFNNSDIINYIPVFCILILISIPIQHFEHLLVTTGEIKLALVLEVSYELLKSAIILSGFYFTQSLYIILYGLIALSSLKFVIVLAYIKKDFIKYNLSIHELKDFFKKQVSHGMPLGAARFFNTIVYFDKLIISTLFSVTQFTIYSVGCFEIPIILGISVTIWDLTAMDMVPAFVKGNVERLKEMWQFTINKIMQFYIPICVYFFLFSSEIILFIFSEKYIDSIPYFRIYILIFMMYSLNFEAVFRSFSANTSLVKIQFFNLVFSLLMIVSMGYFFGPLAALIGKLIAITFVTSIMFYSMSKKIGVSLKEIVDWKKIAFIFSISVFIGIFFRVIANQVEGYLFLKLAFSFSLYSLFIFSSFHFTNIFTADEKMFINKKLEKFFK